MYQTQIVQTCVGPIAVHVRQGITENVPLIFLHGVYFDHRMWDGLVASLVEDEERMNQSARTMIAIDMPLHGSSRENIKPNWTIDDCATMLLDILRELRLEQVIAVGHSWGSMTIMRAANCSPQAFHAVGLCNLRFQAETVFGTALVHLRHIMLPFKSFYIEQVGKALYAKRSATTIPGLQEKLRATMSKLSGRDIKRIDQAVIIDPADSTEQVARLAVPAIAIVGEEDYVGNPPIANMTIVPGGHVSPLEVPEQVLAMIHKLL
jgi:pimeloyl-ACP methyl ester carboxylesterase